MFGVIYPTTAIGVAVYLLYHAYNDMATVLAVCVGRGTDGCTNQKLFAPSGDLSFERKVNQMHIVIGLLLIFFSRPYLSFGISCTLLWT